MKIYTFELGLSTRESEPQLELTYEIVWTSEIDNAVPPTIIPKLGELSKSMDQTLSQRLKRRY